MALSNRDRVERALGVLSVHLEPFVHEVLAPLIPDGTTWVDVIRIKDEDAHGPSERTYARTDVQLQLRVMTENLGALKRPFGARLSRAEENLVSELRAVRNDWAHQKPFGYDDTYRVLDTTERLLRAVGATDPADRLRQDRLEFQRSQYEAQTSRDAKASAMPDLGADELTPWREVLTPHPDVLSGRFKESEFAANLHSVAHGDGQSTPEYDDPGEFFRRTYLTDGLRDLLSQAAARIAGRPEAAPVINLQTTFGGGKTHSMLAVWHLFSGTPIAELPQDVQEVVSEAGLDIGAHQIRRVAVVGNEIAPGQAHEKPDGTSVRTLWGEIAWQLGGTDGFATVADADRTSTSPGRAMRDLLAAHAPCVILIDEWVAYARQLRDQRDLAAGDFDTQFSFAQLLTEAVVATPGALLLVSIPASDVRRQSDGDQARPVEASQLETGGENGLAALQRLEHVVGRVAHQWQSASAQESFEIVRRRLFVEPDGDAQRRLAVTARKFVEFYRSHQGEFPRETSEPAYERSIKNAYPIHPELFARLYEDWSTLERFQRTRGVLRLMSAVVKELYEQDDNSPLIMPGSVPVAAPSVMGELAQYVDGSWRVVVDADVDGPDSLPAQIDKDRPLFGTRALTRRIARAAFLGSAATTGTAHRGVERQDLFLGVAMPGDTVGNFGSALQMLADRASYLFSEGSRFWYDLQPSLNKTVRDRAEALAEEEVWAELVERLRRQPSGADLPHLVVAPTDSSDVEEAEKVRLLLLHPKHVHEAKGGSASPAMAFADSLMKRRGSGNRERRNTVVALAPDRQRLAEADSAVRQHLAWRSVAADKEGLDLTQANARMAETRRDETNRTVDSRVAATWIWAIYPSQRTGGEPATVRQLKVDGDELRLAVRVGTKLVREDVLRVEASASAVHLDLTNKLPSVWNNGRVRFGDLWSYYATYPYLPRLRDRGVLEAAVRSVMDEVSWAQSGFALATGYDESTGNFAGLALPLDDEFGPITDDTWLVAVAPALEQRKRLPKPDPNVAPGPPSTDVPDIGPSPGPAPVPDTPRVSNGRYAVTYAINPDKDIRKQLDDIADEVLTHIVADGPDNLEITVDVKAERLVSFGEWTVRTVRQNTNDLGGHGPGFQDV